MKVNLAVQVLSKSMAEALKRSMPPEVSETAQFCQLMNNIFLIRECEVNQRTTKEAEPNASTIQKL